MKQVYMLVEKNYDYGFDEMTETVIGVYENYRQAKNFMNSLIDVYNSNQAIAERCLNCEYGCGYDECCEFADVEDVDDEYAFCKNYRDIHDTEYGIYTYDVFEDNSNDDCGL